MLNNFQFSEAASIKSKDLTRISISSAFNKIKNNSEIADLISNIRSVKTKEERATVKSKLSYFTLGSFNDNERSNNNLESITFIGFDYDHLSDNPDEIKAIKEKIIEDPRVFAAFISPSGNGIKVIYRLEKVVTTDCEYKVQFAYYKDKLNQEISSKLDAKCKDSARAIFYSHDPDIYINEDAEVLPVVEEKKPAKKINFKRVKEDISQKYLDNLKHIPEIVSFLSDKIDDYDTWMKCGLALSKLGESGREHWINLSSNPEYNDTPEELNEKYDNFLSTASGEIDLGTLFYIALEKGYNFPDEEPFEIEEEIRDSAKELLDKANYLYSKGHFTKLQRVLSDGSQKLKSDFRKSVGNDSLPFHIELKNQFDFDDKRDPNKLLGHELTRFKGIAAKIDGLQPGFYHLAAETNVGKTAFLTNITLDLIETKPDVKIIYYSLDDNKIYTIYRLLSILTGLSINDVKSLPADPQDQQDLLKARKDILDIIKSKRLEIYDISDIQHIDDIEVALSEKKDHNIVVMIDGLYNLEVSDGSKEGIRQENIERAQKVKRLVDIYNIPVISTGELRKKTKSESKKSKPDINDLMETGKFAYNANLVWLLYADNADDIAADKVNLKLKFEKNKISDFKGEHDLVFERAKGRMKEKTLNITSSRSKGDMFGDTQTAQPGGDF